MPEVEDIREDIPAEGERPPVPEGWVGLQSMPVTKANERKLADLHASNATLLERVLKLNARPTSMGVMACRVKALLTLSPDEGESRSAVEDVSPTQVVMNALEGLVIMGVGGDPGRQQAFELAFEEEMKALLIETEHQVNAAVLAGNGPRQTAGGLVLP